MDEALDETLDAVFTGSFTAEELDCHALSNLGTTMGQSGIECLLMGCQRSTQRSLVTKSPCQKVNLNRRGFHG